MVYSVVKLVSLQLLSLSLTLWASDPSLGPYPVSVPNLAVTNGEQLLSALESKLLKVGAELESTPPVAPAAVLQPPAAPATGAPVTAPAVTAAPVPAAAPVASHPVEHAPAAVALAASHTAAPVAPVRHKRSVGDLIVGDVVKDVASAVASGAAQAADMAQVASTTVHDAVDAVAPRNKRDISGVISEVADTVADVGEHIAENAPVGTRLAAAVADGAREVQKATLTDQQAVGNYILGTL